MSILQQQIDAHAMEIMFKALQMATDLRAVIVLHNAINHLKLATIHILL